MFFNVKILAQPYFCKRLQILCSTTKSVIIILLILMSSASVFSQISVSGKIRSSKDGSPIPSVSVTIKGSNVGTVTDPNGIFKLSVPDKNSVLLVTSQGFATQEITIGNNTSLDLTLEENIRKLDEVIVVGYGQQRRRDVTGAISSVSAKALSEVPVSSPSQALQGRVAGLYATTQGYRPGSDVTIRIRGSRSFSAGNDPLFVIDGIPISGGLNDINPSDIESMEVLKDASATAIYGSRGANGVIIVTTKRGKSGAPIVSYDAYYGIVKPLGQADIFDGAEFAEYKRESRRNSGKYLDSNKDSSDRRLFETVELASIAAGRSTDYQDRILTNGNQQSHQLGLSGGSDQTRYALSIGYYDEKGIIPIQNFTRYNMRINLDQNVGKRVRLGASILATHSIRKGFNVNVFDDALQENPLGVPYDSTGNLIFLPTNDGLRSNPLAELVDGANVDRNKRFRLLSSLYGEIEILKGLKYRLNFGPDLVQTRNGRFTGRLTNDRRGGDPTATTAEEFVWSYTIENILNYNKILNKVHSINLTGLYSVQTRERDSTGNGVQGVAIQEMEYSNLATAPLVTGVGSLYEKWTILSYMARINYSYNGKYLITLTGRADGSSRFAPGNKWGFFPSVAVAWNISNENFLSSSTLVSNLKLRASYGETGNTGINPYQTLGGLSRTTYAFDANAGYGYRPGIIPNPNLRWETTSSLNLGLDFGLFNNRVSGSIEVYRQNTHDLLLQRQLPLTSGFANVLENIGSTRNKGIELTLSTVNIQNTKSDGFTWSTDLNLAHNKEEIVDLYGGKQDDIGNTWFIGEPINVIYDYEKVGIWQTSDKDLATTYKQRVGQIRVRDVNNDNQITSTDRVIIGSTVPRLTGGLTNRIAYKNFDFSIFIFARFGGMINSGFHDNAWMQIQGRYNNLKIDYWTPNNPTNAYPRPDENSEVPVYRSTLRYFDGSFIKIRSINLGYTFSNELSQKIHLKDARFYITVQQPAIFSKYRQKYKGIDPEYPTVNTPATSLISFGINTKF